MSIIDHPRTHATPQPTEPTGFVDTSAIERLDENTAVLDGEVLPLNDVLPLELETDRNDIDDDIDVLTVRNEVYEKLVNGGETGAEVFDHDIESYYKVKIGSETLRSVGFHDVRTDGDGKPELIEHPVVQESYPDYYELEEAVNRLELPANASQAARDYEAKIQAAVAEANERKDGVFVQDGEKRYGIAQFVALRVLGNMDVVSHPAEMQFFIDKYASIPKEDDPYKPPFLRPGESQNPYSAPKSKRAIAQAGTVSSDTNPATARQTPRVTRSRRDPSALTPIVANSEVVREPDWRERQAGPDR